MRLPPRPSLPPEVGGWPPDPHAASGIHNAGSPRVAELTAGNTSRRLSDGKHDLYCYNV